MDAVEVNLPLRVQYVRMVSDDRARIAELVIIPHSYSLSAIPDGGLCKPEQAVNGEGRVRIMGWYPITRAVTVRDHHATIDIEHVTGSWARDAPAPHGRRVLLQSHAIPVAFVRREYRKLRVALRARSVVPPVDRIQVEIAVSASGWLRRAARGLDDQRVGYQE